MKKRRRRIDGPFLPLPLAVMDSRAWRAMDCTARQLWIELRRKLSNGGSNNGKIYLSCRDAAKVLGVGRTTAADRFAQLEHYGFLVKTCGGALGSDGHGFAPHLRFTDLPHGTHHPTRDYLEWDGVLYTPPSHPKKVSKGVAYSRYVRRSGQGTPQTMSGVADIIAGYQAPPIMSGVADGVSGVADGILNFEDTGSSKQDAGQTGGVGSTPTPVANLTERVLGIVNAILDEHAADEFVPISISRVPLSCFGRVA